MVLIIGLINLTGPQTSVVEAQTAPTLTGLTMSHAIVGSPESTDFRDTSLSPSFGSGQMAYTATVENDVTTLRVQPKFDDMKAVALVGDGDGGVATTTLGDLSATAFVDIAFGDGSSKKVIIVVSEDADNDNAADTGAKSTTYTITATEKDFDFGANAAHLDGLAVHAHANNESASVGGEALPGLSRYTKGGFIGFNSRVDTHYIAVPHTAQWVEVRADPGQYDADGIGGEDTDYTAVISPDAVGDSTATNDNATSTIKLASGEKKTVGITVKGPGTTNTYTLTIERQKPQLASLTVTPRLADGENDGAAQTGLQTSLKAKVNYESPAATVDPEGTGTTEGGKTVTITTPGGTKNENENSVRYDLRPGDKTVTIKVVQFLQRPGQATTTVGSTSTATYDLVITRSAPVLSSVTVVDATVAPTFAAATTEYSGTAAFNSGRATLLYQPGPKPDSERADLIVSFNSADISDDVGHQVNLEPGENEITVTVASPLSGISSATTYTYTITRAKTTLTNLNFCNVDADGTSANCSNDEVRLIPDGTTTAVAFDAQKMSYTVMANYNIQTGTVTVTKADAANVKFTKPTSTTALTLSAPLTIEEDTEFWIDVGTSAVGPGNTSTYKLTVKRKRPDITLMVSVDGNGDGDFADDADSVTTTKAATHSDSVGYAGNKAQIQVSRPFNTLLGSLGDIGIMKPGDTEYMDLPWDTSSSTGLPLDEATSDILMLGVGANQFKVRVGGENGAVYTVNITRADPVAVLTVSIDGNGDGDFSDAEDRSVTLPASTAAYADKTSYSESSAHIQVQVNRPAIPDDLSVTLNGAALDWGQVIGDLNFQNIASSDALSLNVGANVFTVRVDGKVMYTITLTREEGLSPEISFTLLNDKDEALGGGAASFMLDASSRQYDFIKATRMDADILLTAAKVRICVADPDGDDVRVSIEDVDVPLCSDDKYLERDLQDGANTLLFDVAHPGDPDGSLHAVSINRADNSKPVFPANASIQFRDADSPIIAIAGEPFSPTVELPFATGGNGKLKYELLSVEAAGPSDTLPAGLKYTLPAGRDTKGSLGIAPLILGGSDTGVFTLVLKVTDKDLVTKDDEDTIEFTILVYRSKDLVPPGAGLEPIAGELMDLVVMGQNKNKTEVNLLQAFRPSVYSYSAVVFTDERDVDIYALPRTTTSTVALEGNRTNDDDAPDGDIRTGWHKWEGFQLRRGPGVSNTYTLVVTDGKTTKRYSVTLMRDPDTAPSFPKRADTKDFYEGINLAMLGGVSLDAASGGNAALSYTLERSHDLAPTSSARDFLGLTFSGTGKGGQLTGTPDLDADPDKRLADRSEVYATYTAHDADVNMNANDAATMAVTIRVHRDVTLESYTVNSDPQRNLGKDSMTYKSNGTFSHTEIDSYIYNAPYNATQVTFMATARDDQEGDNDQEYATVTYTPKDADTKKDGHQINLAAGDNLVTVTVKNGATGVGTHIINIKRPGLQLVTRAGVPGIRITEDQDARGGFLSADVKLNPAFDRDIQMYTSTVETWVQSVKVYANPADATARVWVNDFEIPDREEYSVVDLVVGENEIRVGAVAAGSAADTDPDLIYTVTVTRAADIAPRFDTPTPNYTRKEGAPVDRQPCGPIQLPTAAGGNGAYTYSLLNVEALPPGLIFDPATRVISGTPDLDEGYESIFDLVYAVVDADGNTATSDRATAAFTITITNDDTKLANDPTCVTDTPDPDLPPNTLSSLVVTYTLDGRTDIQVTLESAAGSGFDPNSGGPYTASIPYGATDVEVRANRADDGATISMNSVRIDSGVKLNLPPQATIRVRYPGHSDMIYTLNTVRVSNTAPDFGLATVEDKTYPSGKDITSEILPMATGGNRTLTYTLVDHEGNLPDGLVFTASTRELSGRPTLVQDADTTLYHMTYKVVDADGQSDKITFNITVCDEDRAANCEQAPVNPGYTPMDLDVQVSGGVATLSWTPGDDAAKQAVLVLGLGDDGITVVAVNENVAADARQYQVSDIGSGLHLYLVAGFDANGSYKDSSGNNYFARVVK